MRNDVINHITLDLGRQLENKSVSMKKNDSKTRTLHFTLMSEGEVYTLENILLANIRGKKPDGTIFYNDCVIDGNEVQYEVTSQTIAATGEVICELVLIDRDNAEFCSSQFSIVVYDCIFDDSVLESTNEYSGLKRILNICSASESECLSAEGRVKELLEKALNAQKGAENSKILTEEYKRICLETTGLTEGQVDKIFRDIEKCGERAEAVEKALEENTNALLEISSPEYDTPEQRENPSSGEGLLVALGKIRRFLIDLKDVAFSGKYSDLTGAPTVPEKVSDLENDEEFVKASGTVEKANKAVDSAKLEGHAASHFAEANHAHSIYALKEHTHNQEDLDGTWIMRSVTITPVLYTHIGTDKLLDLTGGSITVGSFDELVVLTADARYTSIAGYSYSGTTLTLEFFRITVDELGPVTVHFMTR